MFGETAGNQLLNSALQFSKLCSKILMSNYYFEFPYLKYYSSTMKYYSAIAFYSVEILEEETLESWI